MVSSNHTQWIEFGGFRLSKSQRSLTHNNKEIFLQPKTFDTLAYLVSHPQQLLSKDKLLEALWPGAVVTENSLTRCILEVRKALGDDANQPTYIQTVPKQGYRFIGELREMSQTGPDFQKQTRRLLPALLALSVLLGLGIWGFLVFSDQTTKKSVEPTFSSDSIAVLPFLNLTGSPDNEMFALGITEEILNTLARHSDLRVAARTSAFGFRETKLTIPDIAERLSVETVLEGSVRQDDGEYRITTQLIDGETGEHLWSQTFDYQVDQLFEIQEAIAKNVLSKLRPNQVTTGLKLNRPVLNPVAYQHYLEGRAIQNRRPANYQQLSIQHFDAAIALEPGFSGAYGRRAMSILLGYDRRQTSSLERAKGDIDSALSIQEDNADALAAAALFFSATLDFAQSEDYARRAIEKDPQLIQAYIWLSKALISRGANEEANRVKLAGLELDPLNPVLRGNQGIEYAKRGDYATAKGHYGAVLDNVDYGFVPLDGVMSLATSFGKFDEAIEWIKVGQAKFGIEYDDLYARLMFARQYCYVGMHKECDAFFKDYPIPDFGNTYWLNTYLRSLLIFNRLSELEKALATHIRPNRKEFPISSGLTVLEADLAFQAKDYTTAIVYYRGLGFQGGDVPRERFGNSGELGVLLRLAFALKQTNQTRQSEDVLTIAIEFTKGELASGYLANPGGSANVALLRWMQGDQDTALKLMEQAVDRGWRHIHALDWDRSWDEIRQTERFKALVRRVEKDLARQRDRIAQSG